MYKNGLFFLFLVLISCDSAPKAPKELMHVGKVEELKTLERKPPPPKPDTLEYRVREELDLLSKEELAIEPISQQQIRDATLQLYVESVANNGAEQVWEKGNDPRLKVYDREKENVRAICLGVENDQYVFMTLRYFVDSTYPNFHIQGLSAEPKVSPRKIVGKRNARFVHFHKMLRLVLSDVRHTGGGQMQFVSQQPLIVKNDYGLEKIGDYDFVNHYSTINGANYLDPIAEKLTAQSVFYMQKAVKNGETASLQTFGNHDICLIKVPTSLWKQKKLVHLGLAHPTETIEMLTRNQDEIYGFRFILLSEEAHKAVLEYRENRVPFDGKESGIYQVLLSATAILSPELVVHIQLLDSLLLRVFKKAKEGFSLSKLSKTEVALIGIDFAQQYLILRKMKKLEPLKIEKQSRKK